MREVKFHFLIKGTDVVITDYPPEALNVMLNDPNLLPIPYTDRKDKHGKEEYRQPE